MGDFTEVERANLASLDELGLEYALLSPTKTGLEKSILDATWEYRGFLHRHGIHNYGKQLNGPEHKVSVTATLLDPAGELIETKANFYRSATRGDTRLWVTGLGEHCEGGEVIASIVDAGRLVLINVSRGSLEIETATDAAKSGGNMQDSVDYWGALRELWSRSTGGSDVAARPSDSVDSFWPTAPRAAGVDEATEWFSDGLRNGGLPRMLFLIGGPGAGKSHAAAAVVSEWREVNAHNDGLAHRTYEYAVGPSGDDRLVVINDATIRNHGQEQGSLVLDASNAARGGEYLLACVNRGILVEESGNPLSGSTDAEAGACLVAWLHGGKSQDGLWGISAHATKDYLKSGTLTEGGTPRAEILAVYLDTCSMLEVSPRVRITQGENSTPRIEAKAYSVQDFIERSEKSRETPAGVLFAEVGAILQKAHQNSGDVDLVDPIAANIQALSNQSLRNNLVSILRSAEIASTQRMTFRELWGAITRTVVGELPSTISSEELSSFLRESQPEGDPSARFASYQRLAGLRYTQAIFGARQPYEPLSNPVTRLTHIVDPTKDARPGRFDGTWDSGWATPVSDAFNGYMAQGSPIDTLRSALPEEDCFHEVVTDFDRGLDASFVALMWDPVLTDRARYEAIAWYGDYLTRLYAVANGIPAFRSEIVLWTQTWDQTPVVPDQLDARLRTLLRPSSRPGEYGASSMIPVFDSRTNPIRGTQIQPKLALKLGDIAMDTEAESDSVVLHLSEHAKRVASIALDFSLIREALASNDGHAGVTELTDATSPRLERFRAARLVPAQLDGAHYSVVSNDEEANLSVRGE
ncbi:hypothetical protein [Arthrobacter sp. zg-Y895]|uniref:hypothetical protein n=1 Tax=Arthrobacter sp. zg-Y895 TaxID=2886933 RepID=UPI001D14D97F|nr:hypothetical protein [Arthrobacter sp. zg-Y895]MCC3302157.1 hypothetical protein [Arthrobacter sp. zg-Y895]